jgi:hypothetical protein
LTSSPDQIFGNHKNPAAKELKETRQRLLLPDSPTWMFLNISSQTSFFFYNPKYGMINASILTHL